MKVVTNSAHKIAIAADSVAVNTPVVAPTIMITKVVRPQKDEKNVFISLIRLKASPFRGGQIGIYNS